MLVTEVEKAEPIMVSVVMTLELFGLCSAITDMIELIAEFRFATMMGPTVLLLKADGVSVVEVDTVTLLVIGFA